MHRFNRRTVQVWYRFVAGIRILSGLRVPGFARSTIRRRSNSVQFGPTLCSLARRLRIVPTRPARQKLKHTGLDLHDERTFRHIVMRFCNFSALTGNFRSGAPSVRCDVARPVHLTASPCPVAQYSFGNSRESFATAGTKPAWFVSGAGWTPIGDRFFGTIGVASPVWSHQCHKSIRSDSCRISKPFSQTPKTC